MSAELFMSVFFRSCRIKRSTVHALSIALVLAGLLHGAGRQGAEDAEIAILIKMRGLVSISHTNENAHTLASTGFLLLNGAVIQTGKDGFAKLVFVDTRTSIIIRPESELALHVTYNAKKISKVCALNSGALLIDVSEGRRAGIDIATPTALATLRTGKTLAFISKNTNETTVINLGAAASIADADCRSWVPLNPNTSAFVTAQGLVHVDSLSAVQLPRILSIVEETGRLKQAGRIDYDLALKSGANGTVAPQGKMVVLAGVGVDIHATADTGYMFAGWQIVDGAARIADVTDSQTQVTIFSNSVITAQFSQLPSKLIIKAKGKGTTVPSGEIAVQKGAPVTITVIPDEGYDFGGWKTSSKVKISEDNYPSTTISLSAARGAITARFIRKKYRLEIKGDEGGVVTPLKPRTVNHGETVDISAVANEGYRFLEWQIVEGAAKIKNPRAAATKVKCDSLDAVIQALFSDNAIEVSILEHEKARVRPRGNFFVVRHSLLELETHLDEGLKIEKWDVVRGRVRVSGTEKATVRCRTPFEIQPVVTTKSYDLTLLATELGSVDPARPAKALHEQPVRIAAIAQKGKHFIRWKLAGGWATIENNQDDSTTAVLSRGPAIIRAEFAPTLCSLKVETTQGGYTEPGGIIKNYDGGELSIQAIPNPKAAFLQWEIVEGEDNVMFSDTITEPFQAVTSIKGDAVIKAVFSTDAVELNVLSNGLGTTSPEGKTYVVKNRWVSIKAAPNRDQAFIQWSAVAGTDVQFKDRLSEETEVSISENSVIKALFSPSDAPAAVAATQATQNLVLKIQWNENHGSVEEGAELKAAAGVPLSVSAVAKKDFYFAQWRTRKGHAIIANPYDAKTTVTLTSGDATIEAQFSEKRLGTLETVFKDYQGRSKAIVGKYK